MFEIKLNQLIEIIKLEKEKMDGCLKFFSEDELYRRVLNKYKELLNILETKDRNRILIFSKDLINHLKEIINKCSNSGNITATFDVVNDNNVPEIEDAYELNEYFNIVFYLYNLFLSREFNRSDYLKYCFSLANLNIILRQIEESNND